MLTSSLSMASASTSCSSSLCNNISNFSITQSSTPIPTHFPPHIKPSKPLKLKAHFPTFSPLSSLPQFSRSLAALDGFEVEEDSESEEQDPGAEFNEKHEEEEEEREEQPKVSASYNDAGRLYVGNLPYSLTSTQLAEVFSVAGTVGFSEIIYERVTDRSRGFGFVTMSSVEEAQQAIRMFNGSRELRVYHMRSTTHLKKTQRSPKSSGKFTCKCCDLCCTDIPN